MRGRLIGVGVGPGDPELLTRKAIRVVQDADLVAYPTSGRQADGSDATNLALRIVSEYIEGKPLLEYLMPMTKDRAYVRSLHDACVEDLKKHLDEGKTVAFVTLGDPSIYSTYIYIHHKITEAGYDTSLVPGVPSFCAAAASMNDSLCEGSQPLVIVPVSHDTLDASMDYVGNKVYMKPGRSVSALRDKLRKKGIRRAVMVEKASLPDEKIYEDLDEAGDKSSYFSLVIVKEDREKNYLGE